MKYRTTLATGEVIFTVRPITANMHAVLSEVESPGAPMRARHRYAGVRYSPIAVWRQWDEDGEKFLGYKTNFTDDQLFEDREFAEAMALASAIERGVDITPKMGTDLYESRKSDE